MLPSRYRADEFVATVNRYGVRSCSMAPTMLHALVAHVTATGETMPTLHQIAYGSAPISADLIVDPQANIAYYLARVAVTPEGLKKLGQRQMQPGMPAEVIIRTGERSMLKYLVGPLVKRVSASMKEE